MHAGLPDHGHGRHLDRAPGLDEGQKQAAGPGLRDPRFDIPASRLPVTPAGAGPLREPFDALFPMARASLRADLPP